MSNTLLSRQFTRYVFIFLASLTASYFVLRGMKRETLEKFISLFNKEIYFLIPKTLEAIGLSILTMGAYILLSSLSNNERRKINLAKAIYLGDIATVKKLSKEKIENIEAEYYPLSKVVACDIPIDIKIKMIDIFLANGYPINYKDECGGFPLMYSISNNNLEVINHLLSKGADINLCNDKGETVLFTAFKKQHNPSRHTKNEQLESNIKIIEFLIEHEAKLSKKIYDDFTDRLFGRADMIANGIRYIE